MAEEVDAFGMRLLPFPSTALYLQTPGYMFMDTPVRIRNSQRLIPIDHAFAPSHNEYVCIRRFSVKVEVERDQFGFVGLYCGLRFDELRTLRNVMAGCNAGITFWNPPDNSFHPNFNTPGI